MKLSVALCTYNGESFLAEQLASILDQTIPVDEVIVCDDGSTDSTLSILEFFANEHANKIIVLKNDANKGTVKSFERGIKECSGDIIFLSDQDDIWYKNKVELLLLAFEKDKKSLLFFSDADLIDELGRSLPESLWAKWKFDAKQQAYWSTNNKAFSSLINGDNKITGATVAFKRRLKDYMFPFDLPKNVWHDTWLGIVAAGLGGLRFIAQPTMKYRIHKQQQIGIGNGVYFKTGDTKMNNYIPNEEFVNRIETMFPARVKACNAGPGILRRILNKLMSYSQQKN